MEPSGNGTMIANWILSDMCCEMEVKWCDEGKNYEDFIREAASENGSWVDAAAWNSNVVKEE